ncbi:MAG TPA: non-heme iron oxygenase ferredoxin subunit [Actinomycetota bacterium]|nr:non-heme iron oxygenase ferredoxin subunit [Actinomycetota bacterium]
MAEWVAVGSAGEIGDGEITSYTAGERQVAIANVDGDLHAFDDLCTHQQCSLAEGELDATTVECPCHGSQFDVTTGEAIGGPATEPVDVFEVREQDGELQVLLDD